MPGFPGMADYSLVIGGLRRCSLCQAERTSATQLPADFGRNQGFPQNGQVMIAAEQVRKAERLPVQRAQDG